MNRKLVYQRQKVVVRRPEDITQCATQSKRWRERKRKGERDVNMNFNMKNCKLEDRIVRFYRKLTEIP